MPTQTPTSTKSPTRTASRTRSTTRPSGAGSRTATGGTADAETLQLVRSAADDARELATAAREQAAQVAHEVAEQGRSLFEEARAQLEEHAQVETERLAEALRRLGAKAESLAKASSMGPGPLADYCCRAAERLEVLADDLETRGPEGILDEVRSVARRRPGAFLFGAALAGFGVGRILRSGDDEGDDEQELEERATSARARNGRRPAALASGA